MAAFSAYQAQPYISRPQTADKASARKADRSAAALSGLGHSLRSLSVPGVCILVFVPAAYSVLS